VIGLTLAVAGGLWLCLWQTRWRLAGVLPIVIGLASIATAHPPDILVSPDGKLAGILGRDAVLLVSNGRSQSFVRDQWVRRTGADGWRAFPKPGAGKIAGMRCDLVGCLFSHGGGTIAFVRESLTLEEDCRNADILIARFTVSRDCTGPSVIIDRRALARHGSHALTWPANSGPSEIAVRKSEEGSRRRLWLGGSYGQ